MADTGELHVHQNLIVSHFVEDDIFEHEVLFGVVHDVGDRLDVFRLYVCHAARSIINDVNKNVHRPGNQMLQI